MGRQGPAAGRHRGRRHASGSLERRRGGRWCRRGPEARVRDGAGQHHQDVHGGRGDAARGAGKVDLDSPASTYLSLPQVANGVRRRSSRAAASRPGRRRTTRSSPTPGPTGHRRTSSPRSRRPPSGPVSGSPTRTPTTSCSAWSSTGSPGWTPPRPSRATCGHRFGSPSRVPGPARLPPPLARPGPDEAPPGGARQPFSPPGGGERGGRGRRRGRRAESTARWGYALYGARVLDRVGGPDDRLRRRRRLRPRDGRPHPRGPAGPASRAWATTASARVPGVMAVIPSRRTSIAILTPSSVDAVPYIKWLVTAGMLMDAAAGTAP